jgi:hypothetical protein
VDRDVLLVVAMVEAALLALAVALLVGHAALAKHRARRLRPRLRAARTAAAGALEASGVDAEAARRIAALPARWQIRLVADLARQLDGERSRRLTELAARVGLVERAERWCGQRRWWRRLWGARLLTALGAGTPRVLDLLADPRPEVRAQAAEWAGGQQGAEPIRRLLDLLDDERPLCRFAVKDSLLRRGGAAAAPVAEYLARGSAGRPQEALEVAAGIAGPRLLEPALTHAASPEAAVRAQAATLLGAIGGGLATERLTALLGDEDAAVRAAAAGALGRLGHWPAAARLQERLADPAWAVRRAAALALREMGAPGALLLRRAREHPDRFARDMAQQVLDLPGPRA